MRLAWLNVIHNRIRFMVTVGGIAAAMFLMLFQGSVLAGFLRAASKLIDSTDAELWIMARGVSCFEFPAMLERRYAELAQSVSGVAEVSRICTGVVQCKRPDGKHTSVALVGAERGVGSRFPLPYLGGGEGALDPEAIVVDESNTDMQPRDGPLEVEINRRRARVVASTSGFSSFLGTPYVFAAYPDAARYLGLGPEDTLYIVLRLHPGSPVDSIRASLQERLTDVTVLTRAQFASVSRRYWVTQTGAGGAIMMVALLGFFVGIGIVGQATYANTMENLEEYATLKALGASSMYVARVVMAQALIYGLCGYLLGMVAAAPLIQVAKQGVPWIYTPAWLPLLMLVPGFAMCLGASIFSVRKALSAEPARVFRA